MSVALKRLERFVAVLDENGDAPSSWLTRVRPRSVGYSQRHWRSLKVGDLRALVALANEAAELKRRVRSARAAFYASKLVAKFDTTDTDALERFMDLVNLRKPLPKPQTSKRKAKR